MKNKVLIIICILLLVVVGGVLFVVLQPKDKIYKEFKQVINDNSNFLSKLSYVYDNNKGYVDVVANYRGAHGENNPHDFKYDFKVEDNKLYLADTNGYVYLDSFNYLNILHSIICLDSNINCSLVTISNDNTDKIYLNKDMLGSILNKNIKEAYFKVNIKGIIKKIDTIDLIIKYDDVTDTITFDGDMKSGRGTFNNNAIKYNKTSRGISLHYGDNFKMNVFIKNNYIEYNIVKDSYTYKIDLYEDKIDVISSGDASIYRGLEMHFKFDKDIVFNDKQEINYKNVCITRYFNALGHVGSEY